MKKRKVSKRILTARKIMATKRKNAGHKYLNNMLKRIVLDNEYHEVSLHNMGQVVCFYCGLTASGVDHLAPISKVDEYIKIRENKDLPVKLLKVSCCAECNRLLASSVYTTFDAKLSALRTRLKRKYSEMALDKREQGVLRRRLVFNKGADLLKSKRYVKWQL